MQIEIHEKNSAFPQVTCDLHMADMRVQLSRHFGDTTAIHVQEHISGRTATLTCTHAQAAAIIALAIGGDEFEADMIAALYTIIGNEIDALPIMLRPIP